MLDTVVISGDDVCCSVVLCVLMVEGMSVVYNEPTSCLGKPIDTHGGALCTLGVFALGVSLVS